VGLAQLNFAGLNKVEVAIKRLQTHVYIEANLAFSGGKDSIAAKHLCEVSGIPYKSHYAVTGLDAPELVQFIRNYHPDVEWCKPERSFWRWFETQGYPTRQRRWCCRLLKEINRGGIIIQGVRWQESPQRKARRYFEACTKDDMTWFLNPIIDWTDKEVWEYIHMNNLPYCSLYDELGADGKPLFKRLGCVLCPMGTEKQGRVQIKRFPKLAEAWHRAFLRKFDEATWRYWLSRKGEPKVNDAQCIMFDN